MQIKHLVREETYIDIQGITLLSIEEYKACRQHIKPAGCVWWLRSPGFSSEYAAFVNYYGYVNGFGNNVSYDNLAVRPALQITNLKSNLKIGDGFRLFDYEWTVISKDLALCDTAIAECAFRKAWRAEDANDYEKSDVKRFLEEWLDD